MNFNHKRDFAYVAKDKQTKIYMCHVFRCDSAPAKDVANALRDTCKRILHEKNAQTVKANAAAAAAALTNPAKTSNSLPKRPNFLQNFDQFNPTIDYANRVNINLKSKSISFSNETNRSSGSTASSSDMSNSISETTNSNSSTLLANNNFLAPMEEPKKTIQCRYLGSLLVNKPTGMSVLNDAIEKIYQKAFDEYKHAKRERQLVRKRRAMMKNANLDESEAKLFLDVKIDDEDIDDYECELGDEFEENDCEENNGKSITFDNLLDIQTERKLGAAVDVVVSPSTVSINKAKQAANSSLFGDDDDEDNLLVECRVRYLCFMGISSDIR
jgi:hypothetical protein